MRGDYIQMNWTEWIELRFGRSQDKEVDLDGGDFLTDTVKCMYSILGIVYFLF